MTDSQKKRDQKLNAIGRELSELHLSGGLTFDTFKSLFARALESSGSDTDDLEMFEPVVKDRAWRDWMVEQLHRSASRRVA